MIRKSYSSVYTQRKRKQDLNRYLHSYEDCSITHMAKIWKQTEMSINRRMGTEDVRER